MKILMVCLGNICRSPIAEGVMQDLILQNNLPWIVESASTNTFHTGEAPHINSQKVCVENGIVISKQRSRLFTKNDFANFDKIYVMASDVLTDVKHIAGTAFDENKVDFLLNAIYPMQNKNVKDPWYGTLPDYYDVFAEIKKACEKIVENFIVVE